VLVAILSSVLAVVTHSKNIREPSKNEEHPTDGTQLKSDHIENKSFQKIPT
jgi:hypothetical protein